MATSFIRGVLGWFGLEIVRRTALPAEATEADRRIVNLVEPFTMTSSHRLWALIQSVRYITRAGIAGDFVECGVWRGGSAMAMALALLECEQPDRRIWLYDTFTGMTDPVAVDVDARSGRSARQALDTTPKKPGHNPWCIASVDEVRANLRKTAYPEENFKLVQGEVEKTLPSTFPDRIALLRLDTDWYESTRVELESLYPRLSSGGVCIIDDYGYWQGARKAVDEYFETYRIRVLLNVIDECGRLFVKP